MKQFRESSKWEESNDLPRMYVVFSAMPNVQLKKKWGLTLIFKKTWRPSLQNNNLHPFPNVTSDGVSAVTLGKGCKLLFCVEGDKLCE